MSFKIEIKTPFDFAQGDRQTERSRSLVSLAKPHWSINLYFKSLIHYVYKNIKPLKPTTPQKFGLKIE